jgi:hypothetical protein
MGALRDLLGSAPEHSLDRETCLRTLARSLGFLRLGPRLRETLEGHLLAAARRNIATSHTGSVSLATEAITDYDQAILEAQLLAAIGSSWTNKDEAIRDAARRLGFLRTGRRIREAFEAVIRSLASAGRIQAEGLSIRRSTS